MILFNCNKGNESKLSSIKYLGSKLEFFKV